MIAFQRDYQLQLLASSYVFAVCFVSLATVVVATAAVIEIMMPLVPMLVSLPLPLATGTATAVATQQQQQ